MGEAFETAVADVKNLSGDPGNEAKLTLYALYKQATVGDVQGKRPGFTDLVGRFKYDAWAALAGTSPADAEQRYVEVVDRLRAGS
jgi:acyl-CoA-binding protein